MSLVWEELEQNPGTAPEVHEGASSTKGLALLQELAREITSGSVCPMMRGEKAGEHPGAFPQQMASRRLEAVWLLCLGREQRPGAWPAQSNYHLPATNLQLAVPKVLPYSHQALQDKPCKFPLELVAFQVDVEGLNFFLHLNHMHKAVIVTAEITAALRSLRHYWSPALGTQRQQEASPTCKFHVGTREENEKRDILLPISQGRS